MEVGQYNQKAIEFINEKINDPDFGDTYSNQDIQDLVLGLAERGISTAPDMFRLIQEHYNSKQEYPRSFEELAEPINHYTHLFKGAIAELTAKDIESSDHALAEANGEKPPRILPLELFKNVSPNLNRPELVKGLLDMGAVSILFGESNKGKTFFALNLALSIALGRDFCGRKTSQGGALYISAEGSDSVRKRIIALKKHMNLEHLDVPFGLVPSSVNLLDPKADAEPIVRSAEMLGSVTGSKVSFIVVDTLARAIAGGNENSAEDMGAFIRNIDRIREATKAHLLIIHHSGKDRDRGARGHSSLRGAVDTELEISDGRVRDTKQRDREANNQIYFRLESVEIGTDQSGDKITSAVMIPTNTPPSGDFSAKLPKPTSVAAKGLEALKLAVQSHGVEMDEKTAEAVFIESKVVDEDSWREVFNATFYKDSNRKTQSSAFNRAKSELLAAKCVVPIGGGFCAQV